MVPRRVFNDAEMAHLRLHYPEKNVMALASDLHCGGRVVIRHLHLLGIKTRRSGWQPRITPEKRQTILDLWEQGFATEAILPKAHTTHTTIKKVLAEAGLEWEPRYPAPRPISLGKYLAVAIPRDHPFIGMAQGKNSQYTRYVLQHRLVMAEHLGRSLDRHETVHHINGDPHDNRIENLQIRVGKHGAGVAMRCQECGSVNIEAIPLASHG